VPEPATGVPPQTDLERAICGVWRDVLGVGQVGVDRNFFDLGADSVTLVTVRAGLEAALARTVPLTALFEHTTVRALAVYLAGWEAAEPVRAPRGDARSLRDRRVAARRG
jgi:acyl carrier protein